MLETTLIATAPVDDFDARWAGWLERGRIRDRTFRRKLLIVVPAIVIAEAIVYLFLVQ
jgi:hypothetical protein